MRVRRLETKKIIQWEYEDSKQNKIQCEYEDSKQNKIIKCECEYSTHAQKNHNSSAKTRNDNDKNLSTKTQENIKHISLRSKPRQIKQNIASTKPRLNH